MTEYHGEFGLIFETLIWTRATPSRSNARRSSGIYEGTLRTRQCKKSSFFFSGNREEEDCKRWFSPKPAVWSHENVATHSPIEFSFRLITRLARRARSHSGSNHGGFDGNSGVGGFNLPEVAANSKGGEHHLFFSLRQSSPKLINELTGRVGHEYGRTRSLHPDVPKLIVQDAFTAAADK